MPKFCIMIKDIHIPASRIRKEIKIFSVIFVLAFLFNFISILVYKTSLLELLTMFPVVLALTCAAYLGLALLRGFISLFSTRKPQP